jgi:23S rRNA (guanosine2251-2'-O)-methyltransferase
VRPTRNKPQKRHATHHAPGKPAAHPPRPKQPQQLPTNLERIFGKHSVRAVFLTRPRTVKRLIIAGDESYHTEFIEMAERAGIKPEFLAWPEFERLGHFTKDEKHQGIFILADPRKIYAEKDFDSLADARVVLALDQISNPQNFATILRSAAFFGVEAVIVLRDRSVDVSSEVVRYAVGGAEFVRIFRVTNLSQGLEELKDLGFAVIGLDERGEKTLAETVFPEKIVFVVGAEGEGLRPKTKKYCDTLVRIPGGRPGLESLNAGVATAVAVAEIFRNAPHTTP